MRYAAALLASLLVLAFTANVPAAEGGKPKGDKPAGGDSGAKKEHVIHGHIKKIDGKTLTISVGRGDNAKDVTVQTDKNTHFTIDHQAAKLEDLKEGELAAVGPAEGVAKHVDINTTHKDKPKGDGSKTGSGTGDKPKE